MAVVSSRSTFPIPLKYTGACAAEIGIDSNRNHEDSEPLNLLEVLLVFAFSLQSSGTKVITNSIAGRIAERCKFSALTFGYGRRNPAMRMKWSLKH
jgi:hypothetical protein